MGMGGIGKAKGIPAHLYSRPFLALAHGGSDIVIKHCSVNLLNKRPGQGIIASDENSKGLFSNPMYYRVEAQ